MVLKLSAFAEKFQQIFGFGLDEAKQWLVRTGTNLLFAVIILVVGWWIAKWAGNAIRNILTKSKTDAGLVTFLSSLVSILMKVLVVVTAVTQLGVQMTSFITILGAAGLAIGMAFSGTLSNFAGGVMILLFKPFKVGDTILAQTYQGKVSEIQIFYTYMYSADNKLVVIPNGPLANGPITNITREKKRRVDWEFSIKYGADFAKANQLLQQFLSEEKRILKQPDSLIALGTLADDHVKIFVHAWVKTEDFWSVYFDMNKRVYEEFDALGVKLPE